jgi:hypothetical protein
MLAEAAPDDLPVTFFFNGQQGFFFELGNSHGLTPGLNV